MFIILGADGKEYGPVETDVIKSWIGARRANLQTRARRDGETEWKTLGDFEEFADAVLPPPAIPEPPAIAAPADEPGTPVPADVNAYAQEIINRGVKIRIGDCIGRAWEFCKKDYWPILGATLIALLLLLTGICFGGLYYYLLRKIRGRQCDVGNVFDGFSRMTGQLKLCGVFQALITLVILLPVLLLILGGAAAIHASGESPELNSALAIAAVVLSIILGAAMVYLSTAWYFAYALVIDKRFKAWDAMEISRRVVTAQWWRMFGLALVASTLGGIGMLACCVGVFFTLPIFFATIAFAYEDLFGTQAPAIPENTPASEKHEA